jgi:hypothetical protein
MTRQQSWNPHMHATDAEVCSCMEFRVRGGGSSETNCIVIILIVVAEFHCFNVWATQCELYNTCK